MQDFAYARGGPVGHHDDAVGKQDGLVDVMRDHNRGAVLGGHDLHEFVLQVRPRKRIERPKGLIEQQDLGLHGERARDAHALLHPARYFVWHFVLRVAQSDKLHRRVGALN